MKKLYTLFFALLLLSSSTVFANSYTIFFAGSAYSPDSLQVNVGDLITWSGSFLSHPLESTSVPAGATAFSSSTGTSFSYTITTAGTYRYHCGFHNFAGVIIASNASSIAESVIQPTAFRINPNPASYSVTISIDESMIGRTLSVYDIIGKKMVDVQLETTNTKLETFSFANGVYFVTVENKRGRLTKKLVIQK